jgi:hypothetical protein
MSAVASCQHRVSVIVAPSADGTGRHRLSSLNNHSSAKTSRVLAASVAGVLVSASATVTIAPEQRA